MSLTRKELAQLKLALKIITRKLRDSSSYSYSALRQYLSKAIWREEKK